jgi:hypothetical protein
MADWTAPFHLPKFTSKEFDKIKRAYQLKYGYTVTVPSFKDVIHLSPFRPMTEQETDLWKKRQYDKIPRGRVKQIRKEKAAKKAKFLAMLASPSPEILVSLGAILTALDDIQDAVSTLACIGLIAAALIGGTTAAALAGPLGWVIGVSTLLNFINPFSRLRGRKKKPSTGRAAKLDAEKFTDKNPFSKKARVKVAKNITRFRPSVGNAIEALQVTDNIWGVGICLGPIMGFVQDSISGLVRTAMGQKVTLELAPGWDRKHLATASKALRAVAVLNGFIWQSDFMDQTYSYIAANLAQQVLAPYLDEYNPMQKIEDLSMYQIQAPRPTDILTLEVIQEAGYTLDQICNWPQNGKQWISYADLADTTSGKATENLNHFAEVNKNSALAFIAGQNAHDFSLQSLATWERADQVEIEYSVTERIILIILDNGWCYPEDIRKDQVDKFEDWISVQQYMNLVPSGKEIWRYAEHFCGFRWAKSEDEYR